MRQKITRQKIMRQLSFLSPEPNNSNEQNPSSHDNQRLAAAPEATANVPSGHDNSLTTSLAYPNDTTPPEGEHPLPTGAIVSSFGAHFSYKIIGPCCRLFDREELPWPCCRLQWRGKEPSWRRIGTRLIPDMAVKNSPSYAVEILEPGYASEPTVMTMYAVKLPPAIKNWWYSKRRSVMPSSITPTQS